MHFEGPPQNQLLLAEANTPSSGPQDRTWSPAGARSVLYIAEASTGGWGPILAKHLLT